MMERERWWLIAALVAALGMWCFFDYIVIPAQEQDAAVHHRLRGNGSDLYPSWIAARELLRHGLDPYSTEVTAEIQKGMWGRPIHPGLPGEPTDESRFAYPVY